MFIRYVQNLINHPAAPFMTVLYSSQLYQMHFLHMTVIRCVSLCSIPYDRNNVC